MDYVVVKKTRKNERVMDIKIEVIFGTIQRIKNKIKNSPVSNNINVAFVERSHLSRRQFNRRLTRKTSGFSKKLQNHLWQFELETAIHNFVRPHRGLKYDTPYAFYFPLFSFSTIWLQRVNGFSCFCPGKEAGHVRNALVPRKYPLRRHTGRLGRSYACATTVSSHRVLRDELGPEACLTQTCSCITIMPCKDRYGFAKWHPLGAVNRGEFDGREERQQHTRALEATRCRRRCSAAELRNVYFS